MAARNAATAAGSRPDLSVPTSAGSRSSPSISIPAAVARRAMASRRAAAERAWAITSALTSIVLR